jgi:hypothetical protein
LATVITNLLSAVPVFGQDLVESISVTEFCSSLVQLNSIPVLATIGTVSPHALKRGCFAGPRKLRLDKAEYLSLPSPFIAFLVGFIDGDCYIQITKTTKGYIAIRLVIGLSLEDISSLEYIYSVLKIGKIQKYPDSKNPVCKIIFNKTDLQEVIFPLLLHHGIFFLTETRRAQFDLCMFIFKNDLKLYSQISQYKEVPTIFKLPKTSKDYLSLAFFKNWLVGFTNAEGSFCLKKNNAFQLKQRIHVQLFEAFKLLFNTRRNILIESDKYAQFSVSSKTDIQTVIDFFSFSGLHPLIGLKNIQYLKWLTNLQNSSRYRSLNFPK